MVQTKNASSMVTLKILAMTKFVKEQIDLKMMMRALLLLRSG